jgi:uncharacterized protein (DUF433 family)
MNPRIHIDPAVCHGKPVIAGTRIPVSQILGALAGGDAVADVLADYPALTEADIRAALDFAATIADREYELISG